MDWETIVFLTLIAVFLAIFLLLYFTWMGQDNPTVYSVTKEWSGLFGAFLGFVTAAIIFSAGIFAQQDAARNEQRTRAENAAQALVAETIPTYKGVASTILPNLNDFVLGAAEKGFSHKSCAAGMNVFHVFMGTGAVIFEKVPDDILAVNGATLTKIVAFHAHRQQLQNMIKMFDLNKYCFDEREQAQCIDLLKNAFSALGGSVVVPRECKRFRELGLWAFQAKFLASQIVAYGTELRSLYPSILNEEDKPRIARDAGSAIADGDCTNIKSANDVVKLRRKCAAEIYLLMDKNIKIDGEA